MKPNETDPTAKEAVTIKKSTIKYASSLIIIFVLGIIVGGLFFGLKTTTTGISANEASERVIKYINENLVQAGESATLVSTEDLGGFYKINTLYQNNKLPVYCSKDGTILFVSQPLLLNETQKTAPATLSIIPKEEKATAELFVMAFCPYGVQAENSMKGVFDAIGSKADIKVRFIASVEGTTADSVQSLHGINEAMEDLRQLCIMKYYPDKYWSYLMNINENCYPNSRDATALDACWKAAAQNQSIDASKIDTCSKSQESLDMMKLDEAAAQKYDVSGSPTLIINGATYNGARTSDGFKNGICSGFNSPPAECGTVINATAVAAPQGGCGA
ncbi:MAG: thioredoxin domain-containing protein [Candidatus Aenigmatarchaeota archaeon]